MSTKRSHNHQIEDIGIDYVASLVKRNNCIFQTIDLKNDQGNDCYIEFIEDNMATSFCVFVQIKSGKSYRDKNGYKIPADKDHLEYWNNHTLPIVGIVYDETKDKAFWGNVTDYIHNNPNILNQKFHNIRIAKENELRRDTFNLFKNYLIDYCKQYKDAVNFGKSLELFSEVRNPKLCYEGLKSLFYNHRNRKASWFYIISNFGKIKEAGIHQNILGMLSNYAANPYIFWHSQNMQYHPDSNKDMVDHISELINKYFGEEEVKTSVSFTIDGIIRGSFSFSVFLVLSFKKEIHHILEKLIKKENDSSLRDHYFWLYIYFSHKYDRDKTINEIKDYLEKGTEDDYFFEGIKELLEEGQNLQIG